MKSWRGVVLALLAATTATASATPLQLVTLRDASIAPPSGGGGDSGVPIISADGRFVLFASSARNLVPPSTNHPALDLLPLSLNVFLRDRSNATTRLVSVNLAGTGGGNGDSLPVGVSTNGRYALFESGASDLVASDTNSASDVFVRDLVNGTTALASLAVGGGSGNGVSRNSIMTPDGRFVAFVSAATNLVAGDTNKIPDVFVRDLQFGTTTLASTGAASTSLSSPTGGSATPEITPDGRFVAFYSTATNLVPGVKTTGEVYVRDLLANTTTWASTNARSLFFTVVGTSNAVACNHRISDDGQFVAFVACTNVVNTTSARGVVLRFNRQTSATDMVHSNANVALSAFESIRNLDLSPDGRFVAFVANDGGSPTTSTAIYRWDAQTATSTLVSGDTNNTLPANTTCDSPAVSADGRYVAFLSSATNLTTNALLGGLHFYVRDVQTGVTRLVDADTNGVGTGVSPTSVPSLSADGRFVAFECGDGSLVANDRNLASDVFVRDLVTETTELISIHHPAMPSQTPRGPSGQTTFAVSADGRFVALASEADDLVVTDTNGCRDVFVCDLLLGTNFLVSAGLNGEAGSGPSFEPAISGAGRFVAFTSGATNLVANDTNLFSDVFVNDLQSGLTELISVSTNGISVGNSNSFSPAISTDGRFVLFRSMARNLAAGVAGTENLFLRDRQSATTYALTTNSTTSGGVSGAMTPDGRFVAYPGVIAGNLPRVFIWDSLQARRVFTNSAAGGAIAISPNGQRIAIINGTALTVTDLPANTNWVIGASVSQNFLFGRPMQFSADGQLLAYGAKAANSPADTNGTYDIYLYDVVNQTNVLVSRRFDSPAAPNDLAEWPSISPDGRFVAYRSTASNNVPGDLNGVPDLLLFDRLSSATILVSARLSGSTSANNRSRTPVFSGDSSKLFFQSWASDLASGDFNQFGDLFALSLAPPVLTDSDGDGMDDQWEMDQFTTKARDGTGDFDNDGAKDLFEFQSGTGANDPASRFRADLVAGQIPSILWPFVSGKTYRVQFKDSLSDADWQYLNGSVSLVGNSGVAYDLAPATGQRFYRILLNP